MEEGGTLKEEEMMDNELGPWNWKKGKEAGYEADYDGSNARLHLNLKKSWQYIIILENKGESSELKDDKVKDCGYAPKKRKSTSACSNPFKDKRCIQRANDE